MAPEENKILIVDDDVAFCETLSDILAEKGYKCVTVYSGKDAVKRAKKEKFGLVLVDISMPVMDGVQTFKEIKKDNPSTTVIMMTAFSVDDLIKNALREGAYGVLRKPLDINKIVSMIEASKEKSVLVMVIDDDVNTRETLRDILAGKGFTVTLAKSGEEAIEIARTRPQDIVLIDIKLPLLNGLETYSAIKKVSPNIKAIFMTAYREQTQELVKQALEQSAYACLYKPFEVEAAVDLIKELYKAKQ